MLKGKLQNFANTYETMYNEGKGSIYHMQSLGLEIPEEFKISAQYVLTKQFNDLFVDSKGFISNDIIQTMGGQPIQQAGAMPNQALKEDTRVSNARKQSAEASQPN